MRLDGPTLSWNAHLNSPDNSKPTSSGLVRFGPLSNNEAKMLLKTSGNIFLSDLLFCRGCGKIENVFDHEWLVLKRQRPDLKVNMDPKWGEQPNRFSMPTFVSPLYPNNTKKFKLLQLVQLSLIDSGSHHFEAKTITVQWGKWLQKWIIKTVDRKFPLFILIRVKRWHLQQYFVPLLLCLHLWINVCLPVGVI